MMGRDFPHCLKLQQVEDITVPSEVISDLVKHKSMISSEKKACGSGYKDNNLVVCTTLGTPQSPRNLNRTFQRLP